MTCSVSIHTHMYVCMYVCMHACMYVSMYVCMYVCIYVCMYVCMYLCVHVCMHACMHACMYVRMYVCMHEPFTVSSPWAAGSESAGSRRNNIYTCTHMYGGTIYTHVHTCTAEQYICMHACMRACIHRDSGHGGTFQVEARTPSWGIKLR
jgi:hypothetical protein